MRAFLIACGWPFAKPSKAEGSDLKRPSSENGQACFMKEKWVEGLYWRLGEAQSGSRPDLCVGTSRIALRAVRQSLFIVSTSQFGRALRPQTRPVAAQVTRLYQSMKS